MHRKLLEESFKKAEIESGETSSSGLSRYLATKIEHISGEAYGYDALRGQYRKINKDNETIKIRDFAANALSQYLGFKDFIEFNRKYTKKTFSYKSIIEDYKITFIVSIILIVSFVIYISVTKQCWMIWDKTQYIEVDFDTDKYNLNQLKLCNQDRIESFRKINATCETQIFGSQGEVLIWYGKNIDKELEYFTSLGLHPTTGESLKPMTNYMKTKYLCN